MTVRVFTTTASRKKEVITKVTPSRWRVFEFSVFGEPVFFMVTTTSNPSFAANPAENNDRKAELFVNWQAYIASSMIASHTFSVNMGNRGKWKFQSCLFILKCIAQSSRSGSD